eukprot:1714873-Prorocentrum_lima.AAC.1
MVESVSCILLPSIKGSLMNSPPLSDCNRTIWTPNHSWNQLDYLEDIHRESDLCLGGATQGINTLW